MVLASSSGCYTHLYNQVKTDTHKLKTKKQNNAKPLKIDIYVYVCIYSHVCACACEGQKRAVDPLRLKLKAVESQPTWVC